jgi:hypothetical protein
MPFKYKYNWIAASELGYGNNDINVVESFGVNVIKAFPIGIADCTMVLVDKEISPLPAMMTPTDYDFDNPHHVSRGLDNLRD